LTPERDIAAELRLRPERPPVTRLSRKVITGLMAIAAIAVCGALTWGLSQRGHTPTSGNELYNTGNKQPPEGLAALPHDYAAMAPVRSGVPVLGPPLPGDLGRPILAAQGVPISTGSGLDAEQQRRAQEKEAARTSRLFATSNATERATPPVTIAAPAASDQLTTSSGRPDAAPIDPDAIQNMQDRKVAFLTAAIDRKIVSSERLTNPASRYVVQAGSVIPAALITGLRSDLPGQVTAQVTENVYDTPTGKYLLIPQGSKLVGTYDSQVAWAGSRPARLDAPPATQWALHRVGTPAECRHSGLCRARGRR
jgi:type IV secretion system protein TrbI